MAEDKIINFDEKKKELKAEIEYEINRDDDLDDVLGDVIDNVDFGNQKRLAWMNERHAVINDYFGRTAIVAWQYDPVANKKVMSFRTKESFQIQYLNQTMPLGEKTIDMATWWLKSVGRKEYETVIFDPSKPREYKKCLNLWEGTSVQPKKGSWKKTKWHIYNILCNRDKIKFRYFMKWLAWCIQNPSERAEVAVIFKGREGAGKGFIFSQMLKIYGKHGMAISNREQLTGKFNAHFRTLVFLFADEAYYPGDKSVEGVLKQIITEPTFAAEGKGEQVRSVRNCLHIGMSTNNDWVIPASGDSRRFFINQVDNAYSRSLLADSVRKIYFNALWGEMDNGGREAMLYDLQHLKLNGWHPRDDVPTTDELKHQITLNMPKPNKLVLDLLDGGIFPGEKNPTLGYIATAKELKDYFEEISPDNKVPFLPIANILHALGLEKRTIKNSRCWTFYSLGTMRKRWVDNYGDYAFDQKEAWELKNPNF